MVAGWKKLKRFTLENPEVPLFKWGDEEDYTEPSVATNPENALKISSYYGAVKRVADTIASLSFRVVRKVEGGFEYASDHPLDELIGEAPHPLYTSFHFRNALVANLLIYGNSYARIVRTKLGAVKRLEVLHPSWVIDITEGEVEGELLHFYIIQKPNKAREVVPAEDIIHLKGLTLDGINGKSPTELHQNTIGAGLSALEYEKKFFSNNAHISFAIELPMAVSEKAKQNIESAWRRFWRGLKNAFRPFILDSGAKLHKISATPAEAMSAESRQQVNKDISRITGVPTHMLAGGENTTFASVEVMMTDYVMFTIRAIVKQLEQVCNMRLFTRRERAEGYRVQINIDSLLRGDIATRTKKDRNRIQVGHYHEKRGTQAKRI
ncbi:MAG: hypothetical protein KatS3mg031_2911 [Chitinophagales bacterium]|nr:MAG: hypothetical protein KatS3mg031_2911 [Chitinophagales bacterium]